MGSLFCNLFDFKFWLKMGLGPWFPVLRFPLFRVWAKNVLRQGRRGGGKGWWQGDVPSFTMFLT